MAAGFGPINVYCLSTGLRHGFQPAWGVGLGAAVVDGLYALLAGLGAAALFTGGANGWFQILGGVALVAVAVRMALAARRAVQHRERGGARLRTTFALSLRRRSRTR